MNGEGDTSGSLNREGIADLPLLRKLLAIRKKATRTKHILFVLREWQCKC